MQLNPSVDLKHALGKHAWAKFTKPDKIEELRREYNGKHAQISKRQQCGRGDKVKSPFLYLWIVI